MQWINGIAVIMRVHVRYPMVEPVRTPSSSLIDVNFLGCIWLGLSSKSLENEGLLEERLE